MIFDLPMALPILPACFSQTSEEVPASLQRLLRRAERHIADRHYPQAITTLRRAIEAGADPYVCTLRIADLECRLEHWVGALYAAEEATRLDSRPTLAYEMLITIALQAGDYARAIRASQTLIKLMPSQQRSYDTLSAIYMQIGDTDAALRVLHSQIRLDPDNPTHHYKKGLLCQHKGEIAMAVDAFTLARELDPNGPCAEEAEEALQTLDALQLNQVLTLGMEDLVFRTYLLRDAEAAAAERGFALSEQGNQILADLCIQLLPHSYGYERLQRYN